MNTLQNAISSEMENREILARNLVRLRNMRKLSQEELGFRAGLHRSTIGNLESGRHSPTFKNIMKLAGALEVRVEELLAAPEER